MSAKILDGKILAVKLKEELKLNISTLRASTNQAPRLVSILVGDDASSQSYALSQKRTAETVGIDYELSQWPATVTEVDLLKGIAELNQRQDVHGIILNKPLPQSINLAKCQDAILATKDVEGMNIPNLGRLLLGSTDILPCTAAAAVALLKSSGVDLKGKQAVVLGRSEIVGKPVALLLLKENATVTICHSSTLDLKEHVQAADIVIAAVGRKRFVPGDWIKSGAIVIDVGINDEGGKIVGDVDFDACAKNASFITPVPGGVGPVTSIILMTNAFQAYRNQIKK